MNKKNLKFSRISVCRSVRLEPFHMVRRCMRVAIIAANLFAVSWNRPLFSASLGRRRDRCETCVFLNINVCVCFFFTIF